MPITNLAIQRKRLNELTDFKRKFNKDIKEAELSPSSELEKFRQEHGTKEEEKIVERDLPEPTDDVEDLRGNEEEEEEQKQDIIYDKAFFDRLVKENAELQEENIKLKKQFSFDYDLESKDQVLPLKVTVYPEQKYGHVRLRKNEKAK
jgi:transposase-like protein